jgi:hypothetical protein
MSCLFIVLVKNADVFYWPFARRGQSSLHPVISSVPCTVRECSYRNGWLKMLWVPYDRKQTSADVRHGNKPSGLILVQCITLHSEHYYFYSFRATIISVMRYTISTGSFTEFRFFYLSSVKTTTQKYHAVGIVPNSRELEVILKMS